MTGISTAAAEAPGACPAHTRGLPCFRKFNRGRHVNLPGFMAAATRVRGRHANLLFFLLPRAVLPFLRARTPPVYDASRVPRLHVPVD